MPIPENFLNFTLPMKFNGWFENYTKYYTDIDKKNKKENEKIEKQEKKDREKVDKQEKKDREKAEKEKDKAEKPQKKGFFG